MQGRKKNPKNMRMISDCVYKKPVRLIACMSKAGSRGVNLWTALFKTFHNCPYPAAQLALYN